MDSADVKPQLENLKARKVLLENVLDNEKVQVADLRLLAEE